MTMNPKPVLILAPLLLAPVLLLASCGDAGKEDPPAPAEPSMGPM